MIEEVLTYRSKYFEAHEPAYRLFVIYNNLVKRSQENKLDPYPYKTVRVIQPK